MKWNKNNHPNNIKGTIRGQSFDLEFKIFLFLCKWGAPNDFHPNYIKNFNLKELNIEIYLDIKIYVRIP